MKAQGYHVCGRRKWRCERKNWRKTEREVDVDSSILPWVQLNILEHWTEERKWRKCTDVIEITLEEEAKIITDYHSTVKTKSQTCTRLLRGLSKFIWILNLRRGIKTIVSMMAEWSCTRSGESDTFNLKNIQRISEEYPKKYEVQLEDINYKTKKEPWNRDPYRKGIHESHIEFPAEITS